MTGPRTVGNTRRMLREALPIEISDQRSEIAELETKLTAARAHLEVLVMHAAIEGVEVVSLVPEGTNAAQQT